MLRSGTFRYLYAIQTMKPNLIKEKSFTFALDVISLYKILIDRREYVMSKQLLKSGTSIGANVREAEFAQSRLDFVHKLSISLKEANETEYWLELLKSSGFANASEVEGLQLKVKEILRLLTKIVNTTKSKV